MLKSEYNARSLAKRTWKSGAALHIRKPFRERMNPFVTKATIRKIRRSESMNVTRSMLTTAFNS